MLTLRSLHARRPRDLTLPERQAFHILAVVTRGEGAHELDFVEHRLRRGQVMVVTAGQVQRFAPPSSFDARLLLFRPEVVAWTPRRGQPVVTLGRQRLAMVLMLLDALEAELAATGGRSVGVAARLVDAIWAAVDGDRPPGTDAARLVGRFLDELERLFPRSHEVATYAALLRVSTRTLARHCVAMTGRGPKHLIDERLSLEARRLLVHGDVPVQELSARLGFETPSHFSRFFKRVTAQSPIAFRDRAWAMLATRALRPSARRRARPAPASSR